MRVFKDSGGNTWQIELTIGNVMRMKKAEGGCNLFETQPLAEKLHRDLGEFWEMLWLLIEPQAAAKNIDAEAFGKLMNPSNLVLAQGEFFKEWADFFRDAQQPQVATALEKLGTYQAKALKLVQEKLGGGEMASLDEAVEAKMRETLNKSFGSLQESLGLTLEPSPSAN